MSNNKAKIAETVLRALAKGDPGVDFPVKSQEVVLMIPKAAQYVFDLDYKEKVKKFGDEYIDTRWLCDFNNIKVHFSEKKGLFFSKIPATYMNLPKHSGLYHISTQKDQVLKFKAVPHNFISLYDGLESQNLGGYIGYWPEGKRVYFTPNIAPYATEGMKLLFKLICILDFQKDYDDIFIPPGLEFAVIDTLKKYYLGELALLKDYVADNRPIIQTNENATE